MFVMALTFLGIGSLAREAGVSLGFALASTVLIWAGPAQVIFFGALINGLSLPAIALSVSLSSVRLLPMCVSMLPYLRGQSRLATLYSVHLTAVTGWAESIHRFPHMAPKMRLPWFMGLTHGLYLSAFVATAVGYVLSGELPRELAAGLLFVTPIYFVAALVRNVREPVDWMALVFGFALAPVAKAMIGAGFDLLFVGLVGGTAAWGAQRLLKARRAGKGGA
jgi:predicted branched-subunit amino acid permease